MKMKVTLRFNPFAKKSKSSSSVRSSTESADSNSSNKVHKAITHDSHDNKAFQKAHVAASQQKTVKKESAKKMSPKKAQPKSNDKQMLFPDGVYRRKVYIPGVKAAVKFGEHLVCIVTEAQREKILAEEHVGIDYHGETDCAFLRRTGRRVFVVPDSWSMQMIVDRMERMEREESEE